MTQKFSGKVVFLTGGTGALGRIVAESFYLEGARIASTYLLDKELESFPPALRNDPSRVLLIKADVTQEEEVEAAFDEGAEAFGTIDFLLNIAGGFMGKTPISELEAHDWDWMINMNLRSTFLCSRSALRIMTKKGSGRIISMSAMPGLKPSAGRGAYAISKAGVAILTQIIADEVKGTGITANAIAPSIIATEANIRSSPGEDYSKWVQPKEIADLILFLCSDAARSINGAIINAYGGV